MQPGKSIKIFINYFLGPVLLLWLSWSIYHQIRNQAYLEESWLRIRQSFYSTRIIYLITAVLLIPVNWGIESWKWKVSVQTVQSVKFAQAFKAVLAGVSFSVTMPNRVGEYLGRMMYLPEGKRLKAISVTVVGSFAQLLVTIAVGSFGLAFLRKDLLKTLPALTVWWQFIMYGTGILMVLSALLYFNIVSAVNLFRRWMRSERHAYLLEAVQHLQGRILVQLFLLSLLRYLIFVIQYILLFYLFGVEVDPYTCLMVMSVVFLSMAIIPSITLVEVWLRGEVLIMIMGIYSSNVLGISFTSVTVWFLNLILPAIAGSLLMLNLRVFNRRSGNGEGSAKL